MRQMTRQQREREAWTRHVLGPASVATVPGRCSECQSEIPQSRLKKNTKTRTVKTCSVECGRQAQAKKYGGQHVEFNGRLYPSKREARIAQTLQMLEQAGEILELCYQVRFVLVEGRAGVRAVSYWADFTYRDHEGRLHVIDAKGMKTDIYKLKKALAFLLLKIEIEEM